jgi:hypothetical protein
LSETHFSKEDWRPGKRRRTYLRRHAYGGRKKAPEAFLAAAKLVGLHTNTAKRCTAIARSTGHTCKKVALLGATTCLTHGGGGQVKAKNLRPYVTTEHRRRVVMRDALRDFERDAEGE